MLTVRSEERTKFIFMNLEKSLEGFYGLKSGVNPIFSSFFFQDSVSVHNPGFYAKRFLDFMAETVFKKIPSRKLNSILYKASIFAISSFSH